MGHTFTRMYVEGCEKLDRQKLVERLGAMAFRPIDLSSEDDSSSGWCGFFGTYEDGVGSPDFGDYIAFGLRTDTLRIPKARLRHDLEIEVRRTMEAHKVDTLNRYQLAEVKETVTQRLRRVVPPSISHVPIVLDLAAGVLWVFSSSETVIELVDGLFMRTTEHALTREMVYTRLRRLDVPEGAEKLGTFTAVARTDDRDYFGVGDLLDRIVLCRHLAPEFMLWLWWRSERDQGVFDLGGELGVVEVWADDRMVLASDAVNAQTDTFAGGHPATSAEAREALRLGKMPRQFKFAVVRASQRWQATMKADDLALSGVVIPAALSREDDTALDERMVLLATLCEMVDRLLVMFVEERTSAAWPGAHEQIREWALSSVEVVA